MRNTAECTPFSGRRRGGVPGKVPIPSGFIPYNIIMFNNSADSAWGRGRLVCIFEVSVYSKRLRHSRLQIPKQDACHFIS